MVHGLFIAKAEKKHWFIDHGVWIMQLYLLPWRAQNKSAETGEYHAAWQWAWVLSSPRGQSGTHDTSHCICFGKGHIYANVTLQQKREQHRLQRKLLGNYWSFMFIALLLVCAYCPVKVPLASGEKKTPWLSATKYVIVQWLQAKLYLC